MKKWITVVAAAVAVCLILSGCTGALSFDNSELMRPPRATGDRAEIQNVIDESAGGAYTFKYPQSGDYRSAIIMYDITGDGQDEALAIYRTSGEEAEIHVILVDEVNGSWSLVGDFKNSSPEVSQVIFADLDGDETEEIIVGYSTYSSLVSSLAVYSYNGMSSQNVTVNETYSSLIMGDFTGNGIQEIMLVSLENSGTLAGAKLMYYSKETNSLTPRSTVGMDSGVSRFASINYCRIAKDVFGIVADGQSVDNNYYTQIVYFDKITGQLKNSLYDAQNENKSMHRQENVISADIDGDSVTEVPISMKMPYDPAVEVEELVASELVYYEYKADENTFVEEDHFISNPAHGYVYKISDDLIGKITARVDTTAGTMTVFSLRTDSADGMGLAGAPMFTLRAFTPEQWNPSGGYKPVAKSDSYIIGLALPDQNPFEISDANVEAAIILTDGQ